GRRLLDTLLVIPLGLCLGVGDLGRPDRLVAQEGADEDQGQQDQRAEYEQPGETPLGQAPGLRAIQAHCPHPPLVGAGASALWSTWRFWPSTGAVPVSDRNTLSR